MKPVIIISLAFVLLIPISALGQGFEYEAIKEQERLEQKYGTFEELQQEAKDIIKNIPVEEREKQRDAIDLSGGCLIATATYGSELAPQVQFLREIRDNTVMSTSSGMSFMTGFNQLYYSFSPTIADLERENPMFQEAVRVFITPMISTLSIMTLAEDGSEGQVLGLGISVIALNLGMYLAAPAIVIWQVRKRI